jgi:Fe-Mn family superoxide dismutase
MKRREFIEKTALIMGGLVVTSGASGLSTLQYDSTAFTLPKLPYAYDALEPFIDKATMEIHHSKHHQGYVNNLNKALEGSTPSSSSLSDILKNISKYSTAVRNNAGGHFNHSLFWAMLTPHKNTKPSKKLQMQINKQFESLDNLKTLVNEAASKRFGSGWAWLSVANNGDLFISSTPNQDNPLMNITEQQGTPILGIDVWEHAYYLQYQNKRGDYLSAIWNVIDWREISNRYEKTL